MGNIKTGAAWALVLAVALIFLTLSITGRLGILLAIALVPDDVARIQQ